METNAAHENINCPISEVNIWLDKYEDLFSQYDSSDYKARTLSDSFLAEVRKLVRQATGNQVELKFNIMQDATNAETEAVISENIHNYFVAKAKTAREKMKSIQRNGILMAVAGFLLISFLITMAHVLTESMVWRGVEIMMDPLGWFLIWNGLDLVFVQSKNEMPNINSNLKIANAKLTFISFGMPIMLQDETGELALAS